MFCQNSPPWPVRLGWPCIEWLIDSLSYPSPFAMTRLWSMKGHHVQIQELDHKEGSVLKNWCFQTVALEKTLESPMDSKEIKAVSLKGNQPWILIGKTDAEAEAPIFWPPDVKNWLIGKDPDAGKDWRREEKRTTEDEMVQWHHRFNGHEFEQAPGASDGQGSLACCSPWGRKESDMTEQLNWTNWVCFLRCMVILFSL